MRIRRVCLQTEDLEGLRRFYGETLAIPIRAEGAESFTLALGPSELAFRRGVASPYHYAINVPSDGFAAAQAWLAGRTPLLPMSAGGATMHWRAWNAHACYFRDPAGNIGEWIARHDLAEKATVGGAFDPSADLRGISEIGLALDDVGAACQAIQEALALPVWDAGDGVRFRALGGERGLLICVKRGRAWYPTADVRAEPAPLGVTFAGEGEREIQLPGTDYVLRVGGIRSGQFRIKREI